MIDKTKHKIKLKETQPAKLKMCDIIKNIVDNEARSDNMYAVMIRELPTQYSEYERDLNGIRMDIYRRKNKLTEISQNLKCG